MISALSAFLLTSRPHVGPTVEMLTSLDVVSAYFASASVTVLSTGLGRQLRDRRR